MVDSEAIRDLRDLKDLRDLEDLLDQAENLVRTGDLDPQDLTDEVTRKLTSLICGNELPN